MQGTSPGLHFLDYISLWKCSQFMTVNFPPNDPCRVGWSTKASIVYLPPPPDRRLLPYDIPLVLWRWFVLSSIKSVSPFSTVTVGPAQLSHHWVRLNISAVISDKGLAISRNFYCHCWLFTKSLELQLSSFLQHRQRSPNIKVPLSIVSLGVRKISMY